MKRISLTIAAGLFAAGCAAAQEDHFVITSDRVVAPQIKIMGVQGGVMGKPVKGAPYSGVEVNENTQVLADGTRIHNESQTQVYRDSEGRMRRESPNEVTIWDPVGNASWVLNVKAQTARKMPMGVYYFNTTKDRTAEGGVMTRTMVLSSDKTLSPAVSDELKAKMKAELDMKVRTGAMEAVTVAGAARNNKAASESLGKRMIEGVNAEGTKTVITTEQGAIGNDRPLQTVSERWFSPELQTVMLTRHSDPRSGEEIFKLINVNRSEPPPYLFQVPAGYQIIDQKQITEQKQIFEKQLMEQK